MREENRRDFREIALEFTEALTEREYEKAYAMTTEEYRKEVSMSQMRAEFEGMIPDDWGPIGPVEVGETLANWPTRQTFDSGWAYVSIGGEMYSEAVTVIVTEQNQIREVEFGRP